MNKGMAYETSPPNPLFARGEGAFEASLMTNQR